MGGCSLPRLILPSDRLAGLLWLPRGMRYICFKFCEEGDEAESLGTL